MNYFRNLFVNRYGMDNLSFALILISLILTNFRYYIWIIGIIIFIIALFRIFSRDFSRRRRELEIFNKLWRPVQRFFSGILNGIARKIAVMKSRHAQRKDYIFLKCPKCHKTLRLPRGKGKLKATCPVCRQEFYKTT